MKEKIVDGVYLAFVATEDGKLTFSSNDSKLQAWVESCKNKKVKPSGIHFVVKAAKEYLKQGAPEVTPRNIDNVSNDPVSALNNLCQQRWQKTPIWEVINTEQIGGFAEITVRVTMPDGLVREESAPSQKIAKKLLAIELSEDYN